MSKDITAPTALRVLVVDDDPVSRLLAVHVLAGTGHDVSEAGGAPEARAVLAETPVDVIVSDLSMPEESGLDLLVSLDPPRPFVLLTGVAERDEIGDDRAELVTAFLTKPVQSAELIATVAEVAGESPAAAIPANGAPGES